MAFVAFLGLAAPSDAANASLSDDELATLTDVVMRSGAPGTLSAIAAEKFGLEPKEYAEKFVEMGKAGGTRRSVELVSDADGMHVFFSQRTRVESITARSSPDGEFIVGLQRQNDSDDVQELTGNQGRAFVNAELAYWMAWLEAQKQN